MPIVQAMCGTAGSKYCPPENFHQSFAPQREQNTKYYYQVAASFCFSRQCLQCTSLVQPRLLTECLPCLLRFYINNRLSLAGQLVQTRTLDQRYKSGSQMPFFPLTLHCCIKFFFTVDFGSQGSLFSETA